MVLTVVFPNSATTSWNKTSQPLTMGTILYVGGSGPNNYTKIQDAINESKFGDTIYVYDDSSPYNEFIIINKTISLIGENKNTTIIKGFNKIKQPIIQITANGVHLHGFTIQNGTYYSWPWEEYYAIAISSNNNNISGNILTNNAGGIFIKNSSRNKIYENSINNGTYFCQAILLLYGGNNEIFNNCITGVGNGVVIEDSSFNKIHENSFSQIRFEGGVCIKNSKPDYFALCNKIYKNYVSRAINGIALYSCKFNFIYLNEITNCSKYGVYRLTTSFTFIMENNFINNSCNAYFYANFFDMGITNQWRRNYWDDWSGSRYYTIHGATDPLMDPEGDPVPVQQYDKHPVKEPYDIPGMR